MKKLTSACCLAIALFISVASNAQNITYVIKDKAKKETSDKSVFTIYLKGFSDQKQADVFYDKMRAMPDISGVQDLGKDADGVYQAMAKLKNEKPSMTPIEMAEKLGITHVEKGRSTMTIQEFKQQSKTKGEAHSDHNHSGK